MSGDSCQVSQWHWQAQVTTATVLEEEGSVMCVFIMTEINNDFSDLIKL